MADYNNVAYATSADLLGPPITADYRPAAYWHGYMSLRRAPPFSWITAMDMMTDPRIVLGLWLIKGPILSKARFFVDCENSEVKEFLKTQVTRFWRHSAIQALQSIENGFACQEVLYRVQDGQIHFDYLKNLHSFDCRARTIHGQLVGATVRNVPNTRGKHNVTLEGGRCFWTVHNRMIHQWYGRSRLFGAYLPWLELWSEGGLRDIRRLFFHKYAFEGDVGRHPPGDTDINGVRTSNRDLLREMLEKRKAGAVLTLPNTKDAQGNYLWAIDPAATVPPPEGVMEYVHDIRIEELEGMGIPPEVVSTDGVGAYSGRSIPMDAFYSILQEIINTQASDLSSQILRTLVDINFGHDIPFEIVPFGLIFAPSTPSDKVDEAQQQQPSQNNGSAFSMPIDVVVDDAPRGYRPKYSKLILPAAVVV